MNLRPKFDIQAIDVIEHFIKSKVNESRANGVVIGLSGGLDSATVTKLCANALSKDKVLALIMPYGNEKSRINAIEFSKLIDVNYEVIDIKNIVDNILITKDVRDFKVIGNIKARVRMILLYLFANSKNLLVAGTSNKSELLVGYFTKFGDGGSDILPIGDLYKTQVKELGSYLKIPDKILNQKPTAGLWNGQFDEEELKIKYELLDKILFGIELKLTSKEISEKLEIDISEVERVQKMVFESVHKRKMPIIAKVGFRTIGIDWRESTGIEQ